MQTHWTFHAQERLKERYGYSYLQEPFRDIPDLIDEKLKTLSKEKIEKVLDRDNPCFLVRIKFWNLDCKVYFIYDITQALILTALPPNCMRYNGDIKEGRVYSLRKMIRLNFSLNKPNREEQLTYKDKYLYTVDFSSYKLGPYQNEGIDLLACGQETHEKRKWIFAANTKMEVEEYLQKEVLGPNERVWVKRMFVKKLDDPEIKEI